MITGVSTLAPAFETWGSYLRERGYATYWYGKWHLTRGDRHWNEIDGPPALERYGFDGGTYPSPNGAPAQGWHADPKIAQQFVDWYAQAGGDSPWCTTVSFVNPHDIAWWYRWSDVSPAEASAPALIHQLPANFETPKQLRSKPLLQRSLQNTTDLSFGDVSYAGRELLPSWTPFLDLYVKLQLAADRQIGIVLDTLASRPDVAANTVVIFTADHGEYGASHGLRGKGAGLYEEGINVPLIVNDLRRSATAYPEVTRTQLSSSVDIVPLLLTLASGSDGWRDEARYSHLATRLDLAPILLDPTAPGRDYALHATDEVVTEFALEPYSAIAPIHVVGLIIKKAKYGIYSHWRRGTDKRTSSTTTRRSRVGSRSTTALAPVASRTACVPRWKARSPRSYGHRCRLACWTPSGTASRTTSRASSAPPRSRSRGDAKSSSRSSPPSWAVRRVAAAANPRGHAAPSRTGSQRFALMTRELASV
jgi:hypothetical protein